ncbi:acyl-CoA dehydrogenase/oxidase [Mycotypha africana]|uniref:acyl-CoA dehydrogenase/oxidase n=1 Tax=Mycotypha africana TaxID=64632 RepID=UPI0022FFC80D|nr:acyl-CoA dehydrogenase/oxidase [Mycotypha africana]KAI8987647.1 acyl-CoA dehydrogenase/oxidase [Mycotypha africana]
MAISFPKHLKPLEPSGTVLLQEERKKATFQTAQLTNFIYGTEYLEKKNRIQSIMENDPILADKSHRYYSGRLVRFRKSLAAAKRLVELLKEHNWTDEEYGIADLLFDESSAFRLHRSMFMPTILNQGTEEQQKMYLEPARRYEIIGCYAQTELGHGSNVRGLETTATYHPVTETFELNSPTLTSAKWWIGGLGVAATHAIVMARLISQGKDFGPHPFIVQIRNLANHEPLEGITVGDIGPKFGFNTVDNGFILFDHVRIPHFAMLARYARIEKKTGEYITPPNSKLAYGTMVYVRANIVLESRNVIARAATVAVRYSAVRIQGSDASNPKRITAADGSEKIVETPVLDYTMQQFRLFPIIAQAYACHFTGKEMHRMYHENQERMAQGDFSYLADLHASSSGLKSLVTTLGVNAIEECRRACGGHGYSLFSGLGQFYQDYLPKATWEGDNYLLTQQTARHLFKTFRSVRAGKINDKSSTFSSKYIAEYLSFPQAQLPAASPQDFSNSEVLLSAFKYRTAYLIAKAIHAIDIEKITWNDMLVDIYRISRAHCQLLMVYNFINATFNRSSNNNTNAAITPPVKEVLQQMAILFSLSVLDQEAADFLTSGYISSTQFTMARKQLITVIKSIRPNAVALVDAFDLPDYLLNSALGGSNGNVYEVMTAMAEREPLNHKKVADGYDEFIRPLIHQGKACWSVDQRGVARL